MATFTNQSKSSTTLVNQSKNASTISSLNHFVRPWQYNEAGYTYNQVTDSTTGQPVYYDSVGFQTFTNLSKS